MEIRTVDLSNNPKEIEVRSCISAGHHGIHNHNGECSGVCEVVFLGNRLGHGTNFDGALFDPNGISPTVLARDYKGAKEIIEIRKVDIVNERNKITKSRAEQLDGCVRIGNVYGEQFGVGYAGNVWDSNGVAPTVMTMQGGGRQPHIVEVNNLNDKTIKIKVRHANKKGFEEVTIPGVADLCYPSSTTRRGRVNEGGQISPTLCAENPPSVLEFGNKEFYNFLYEIDGEIYLIRIRKLTPKECYRLMGVSDEDADKMLSVNSNSQCYKQAGNSIVVNVMEEMFKQLF